MEMELDQSQVPSDTTGNTPADAPVGSLDLDKFKEDILGAVNASFDDRFKGFQKMLSKRDQQFNQFMEQYQQSTRNDLTEEEREALADREKDEQIARLQAMLELKELEREYPEVAPHYNRILEADSPREQMEILKEVLTPKAPEQPQEQPSGSPEQNVSSAPVDPNAPADTGVDGMNYSDMFEKDPSLLDRILKGAGRMRAPE